MWSIHFSTFLESSCVKLTERQYSKVGVLYSTLVWKGDKKLWFAYVKLVIFSYLFRIPEVWGSPGHYSRTSRTILKGHIAPFFASRMNFLSLFWKNPWCTNPIIILPTGLPQEVYEEVEKPDCKLLFDETIKVLHFDIQYQAIKFWHMS